MSRAIRMLLDGGRITREQFDRATLRKARHGLTMAFHLIAEGALGEEELVEFFERQFRVSHWPRYKLESIPEEVVSLFSPKLAGHLRAMPLDAAGDDLKLAITDPSLTHVLEEASYQTNRRVTPIVVTEGAMSWALERYYGITPPAACDADDARPIHLTRTSQRETVGYGANPHNRPATVKRLPMPPSPLQPAVVQLPVLMIGSVAPSAAIPEPEPEPLPVVPPEPLVQPAPRPARAERIMHLTVPAEIMAVAASIAPPPPAKAPEPLEPASKPTAASGAKRSSSEILAAIHKAADRDEVVAHALDYLLRFAGRAAFMVVKKDELHGFDIAGELTSRAAVRSYWIPLSSASTLSQVAADRQIHLGPLGRTSADSVLAAALGGRPSRVLAIPVEIKGRVVGLLYADSLNVDMPPWNHLERLAEIVGINLARLIRDRGGI